MDDGENMENMGFGRSSKKVSGEFQMFKEKEDELQETIEHLIKGKYNLLTKQDDFNS